jgi:replicative DNA helicase
VTRRNGAQAETAAATIEAPRNLDAEAAVLGAILFEGINGAEASRRIVQAVRGTGLTKAEFYYDVKHGLIYEAALALVERGEPTDVLAVVDELQRTEHLDAVGGRVAIAELAAIAVASANAVHHARLVRETARRRRGLTLAKSLEQASLNGGIETTPALRDELAAYLGDDALDSEAEWLESAAGLLTEADPGPTPFLIEDLIVEQAIAMMLGSWKVGKT